MIDKKEQFPSIEKLAGGAINEAFDRELAKCLRNIIDPNTSAKAERKITIEISLKPDETREIASTNISVKCKLASAKAVPTTLFIGSRGDLVAATERVHPDQAVLDFEEVAA